MKLEALLYKLNSYKRNIIYNIITLLFIGVLLFENTILLGLVIYVLAIYIVLFFLINGFIDKNKSLYGKFEMSKNEFLSYFSNAYNIKIILIALMPVFEYIWCICIVSSNTLLEFNFINITLLSVIFIIFIRCLSKLLNIFVTIIALIRVVTFVKNNNLNQ